MAPAFLLDGLGDGVASLSASVPVTTVTLGSLPLRGGNNEPCACLRGRGRQVSAGRVIFVHVAVG